MAHATDIVAYTFRADIYCPDCIVGQVVSYIGNGEGICPGFDGRGDAETELASIGEAIGINPEDEHSYDSDEFPKVVFADSVCDESHEYCGECGDDLCGGS